MPWRTILVELEEGPLMISNPNWAELTEVNLNMAVCVNFLDCEDSAGPFKLPVFDLAQVEVERSRAAAFELT